MSDRPEARPRRLLARSSLTLVVQVQAPGLPAVSCQARNVSVGGMFLSTDTPPAPFSELTLKLTLPGGRSATLGARGVHVLTGPEARRFGLTPGIGVQFERLGQQGTAFVSELVDWAVARDPGPRIVRIKPGADMSAVRHEPMLGFLLGYVDGRRNLEALALELALEVDTIERMLGELSKHQVIELVSPPAAATASLGSGPPTAARGTSAQPPPRATIAPAPARTGRSQPPAATQRGSVRPSRSPGMDIAAAAEAARTAAASSSRPSRAPTTGTTSSVGPSRPPAAMQAGVASSRPNPRGAEAGLPLGAAAQILAQAEAAYAAGQAMEASRHLKLLSAMTFDDARTQQRASDLGQQVLRAAAMDFEKQAANEERHQHWDRAAKSWLRVAEGRPTDGLPLQRAVLAQLQAGVELRVVMETARRAVQLAPNDAQAHRTLAKVYLAADMQASANRELEAARRCSPVGDPGEEATPTGLLKRLLGRDKTD